MWKKLLIKYWQIQKLGFGFLPLWCDWPCLVWPFHFIAKSLSVRKCRLRHLGFHLLLINKETVDIAPERWIYLGSAENLNSGSATIASHVQVPTWQGQEIHGEEKDVGRVIVKQSPWLFIGWVLAKKEEDSTFFFLGSAIITGRESSLFWSLNFI